MNVWDVLLLLLVGAMVLLAFRTLRRSGRGRGSCCSAGCEACPGCGRCKPDPKKTE